MTQEQAIVIAEKFVSDRSNPATNELLEDCDDCHYRADVAQILGVNEDGDWIVRVAYSYVNDDGVLIDQGVIDVYIPENATLEDEYFEHDYVTSRETLKSIQEVNYSDIPFM